MRLQLLLHLLSVIGALIYCYLFSSAQLGLNSLIFSVFLSSVVVWQNRSQLNELNLKLIIAANLISALLVVWHHSGLAQNIYMLTFLTLVGYTQLAGLRFIWYGLLLGIASIAASPLSILKSWMQVDWGRWRAVGKWAKLTVIPLILLLIFFFIYYQANSAFADMFSVFAAWLEGFSISISVETVMRFLLGGMIMVALLWPTLVAPIIKEREEQWKMKLQRVRRTLSQQFNMLALKQEYMMAIISLSLLNALLLIVNLTDLRFVWLDFSEKSAAELSNYVHAGTDLLIFAIILAAGVVLYFFRRNLNFFPDANRWLQRLSYLWIIQNALLASSVGLRNYHYLRVYGLTELRVGVMVFLILVLLGLFWVYFKIQYRKSIYHLLCANAWSVLGVLLFTACFNWDVLITRYNIRYSSTSGIDAYHLCVELSDKNLHLLAANRQLLHTDERHTTAEIDSWIKEKENKLLKRLKHQDWRSWNRVDHLSWKKLNQ